MAALWLWDSLPCGCRVAAGEPAVWLWGSPQCCRRTACGVAALNLCHPIWERQLKGRWPGVESCPLACSMTLDKSSHCSVPQSPVT